MKRLILFLAVLLATQLSEAQTSYTVLVQSLDSGTIYRRNPQNGNFVPFITGLGSPVSLTLGPDGALYVLPHTNGPVGRYDACDGSFLGNFGEATIVHGHSLRFGPDGALYVTEAAGPVKRYNGQTGAFMNNFVAGPYSNADGIAFGPGGSFFVADFGASQLLRYTSTGANFPTHSVPPDDALFAQGVLVPQSGQLDAPSPLAVDTSGRLYVGSRGSGEILRYNATTGAFLDIAAPGSPTIQNPSDLRFAPDGTLYIMSNKNGRLYQLNGAGQLTDLTGDLPSGNSIEFVPTSACLVAPSNIPTLSGAAFMVFATLLALGGAFLLRQRRREVVG